MARHATNQQTGSSKGKPSAAPKPHPGPSHEQVARRAYEVFLARGGTHGNAEQDWYQAERELRLGRQ